MTMFNRIQAAARILRDAPIKPKNDFGYILEPNGDGELVPDPQAARGLPLHLFGDLAGAMLGMGIEGEEFAATDRGYARAYIAVNSVRTCVDTYAWSGGEVPQRILRNSGYDRADDEILATSEDVRSRHIWFDAIAWHKAQLNIGLIPAMLYNYMLTDAIYALKLQNPYGGSGRIQILNSQGMTIQDSTGVITSFDYAAPGETEHYPPEYIAYNHGFNPFYDTRGSSIVASIIQEVNIDRNLDTFLQAFFKNDAMPGMTVSPPEGKTWNEQEWTDIKAILRERHRGVGNRRRLLALNAALSLTVNPEPDIEKHTSVQEPITKQIFQAFGVPLVLVGDNSSTAYQAAPDVLNNFIRLRVKPILHDLQEFINAQIMPFLDRRPGIRFEFDFDSLEAPTEADKIKSDIANQWYSGNIAMLNEARQKVGLPEIEGGNVFQTGARPEDFQTTVPATIDPTLPQQPALLPAQSERDETRPITVMLGLAGDVNCVTVQNQAKSFYTDYAVDWTDPKTFHVTLFHIPDGGDAALARLLNWCQSVELPALSLKLGSLNRFDGVGEYPLYVRIGQNRTLLDWQAASCDWLESQGFILSPYSQPGVYTPHITLGYAKEKPPRWTFDSRLSVKPQALQLSYNGEIVYERDWPETGQQSDGVRTWDLQTPDTLHEAQLAELDHWMTFSKRHWGDTRNAPTNYEPTYLRGDKAERIQAALTAAPSFDDCQIFRQLRDEMAIRDIQATRVQFEDAFSDAITAAIEGRKNRRQTGIELRRIILRGINAAFRDGMKAGGVDAEPDDAEKEIIVQQMDEQRQYIKGLLDKVYKDEAVSPALADQKPAMWWGKSIQPAYYAGFESAAANQMVEFTGDDGKESCKDCRRLKGQRHRLKDWIRKHLVPQQDGENFECEGFNCEHVLSSVEARARGAW